MTSVRGAAGTPTPPAAPPPPCIPAAPGQPLAPNNNSAKPLTPFGIEDILGPPRRAPPHPAQPEQLQGGARGCAPASPLCALQELASKTFRGLERGEAPAPGRAPPSAGPPRRKRRKSRTAFTAAQLQALEQRFGRSRYLAPADRDALAARLALSSAQVITWFQNRRAKLKRDLEELRADVASLQALPPAALQRFAQLPGSPGPPGTGPGTAELSEEEIDVGD